MAKRRVKVKRSRGQILENEVNKWQAKKSGAIELLCKAMAKLKELERSTRRQEKRDAQLEEYAKKSREMRLAPEQKAIAKKLNTATKRKPVVDETTQLGWLGPAPGFDSTGQPVEDRAAKMEALGFRKTGKRRAQTAVTG